MRNYGTTAEGVRLPASPLPKRTDDEGMADLRAVLRMYHHDDAAVMGVLDECDRARASEARLREGIRHMQTRQHRYDPTGCDFCGYYAEALKETE